MKVKYGFLALSLLFTNIAFAAEQTSQSNVSQSQAEAQFRQQQFNNMNNQPTLPPVSPKEQNEHIRIGGDMGIDLWSQSNSNYLNMGAGSASGK